MADFQTGPFSTGDLSRSGHQLGVDTGTVNPLHIEEYGGEVEGTIVKKSIMRNFVSMKTVRGTDTITNDRIGKSTLQKVTPGVRPEASPTEFDNVSVKVDTIILARANQHKIDDFQSHYSVRTEIGREHGKEIGKFFDEAMLIQANKAARIVVGTGAGEVAAPAGWQSGTVVTLGSAGDEVDPDKLQRAIEDMCQSIEEKDQDLDGFALFIRPAQYYALLRNDKLVDGDFSTSNGDYAKAKVMESCGLPIFKTNRLPTETTGHYLSNAGNNNAYDTSAAEAKTVVICMHPKALLAGETIPLTSDVYWVQQELQWYIDSHIAFAVTANRPEAAGVVEAA